MIEPTWTFNNFWKTERISSKFHPIIENHFPVKSPQFSRAPYSHAVWWAISDTIKWTPLVWSIDLLSLYVTYIYANILKSVDVFSPADQNQIPVQIV